MSKTRTNVSKYPSKYSPKQFVSAAQYIIELLCEKLARTKHKDLPVCFWHLKEWANFYKSQLRVTHTLLKQYSEHAIICTIKEKNVWSLRPQWVIDYIVKKQNEIDLAEHNKTSVYQAPKEDSQASVVVSESPQKRPFRPSKNSRLLESED